MSVPGALHTGYPGAGYMDTTLYDPSPVQDASEGPSPDHTWSSFARHVASILHPSLGAFGGATAAEAKAFLSSVDPGAWALQVLELLETSVNLRLNEVLEGRVKTWIAYQKGMTDRELAATWMDQVHPPTRTLERLVRASLIG